MPVEWVQNHHIATIHHETSIGAPIDDVWAAIRDVSAVHERLLPGYVVDTRVEDDHRFLTLSSGVTIEERLLGIEDDLRRLDYSAVGGFSIPVTHHRASMQIVSDGPDRSRLVWVTEIEPEDVVSEAQDRVVRAAQVIKETIEATIS